MQVSGLPETFWVVVSPTSSSELGDCCFECDFRTFALQIRGGLDVERIVGIFARETDAREMAEGLLTAVRQPNVDPGVRVFQSPWPRWYATQDSLAGVAICNKGTDEKVVVEPPPEWGRNWAWNLTENGTGIVMRRL